MEKNIFEALARLIKTSLKIFNLETSVYDTLDKDMYLDLPKDSRFGDITTNIALRLSKIVKRPLIDLASTLLEELNKNLAKDKIKDYLSQIKLEGAGFINFYLKESYFSLYLKDLIKHKKVCLRENLGKRKPVLIEFVSANPTGPLSVAHARQAVVGDVLANILIFLGFKAKREFYLNDEGNQINILGESIGLRLKELNGEKIIFPEDHYQGEYIYDIAKEIKDKNLRVDSLSEYGKDYILKIIKEELKDFGVKFDYWYSQKSLRASGKIKKTLDTLLKKGILYEQEGALWFKSTQFGDDKDRVVIKSDGSYTYLAPDIAYHQEKYRRGFKWLINLWGPDHHGYVARLKASVEAFGRDPDSLSIIIVQLATIFREGKPIQMSTRRGQYITLREVLDEVGKDASRFFFLMRRTSSHLDFDLDIAKKQTAENPVFYVQYAYARISSILRNSNIKINCKRIDFSLLREKEEISLIKKLWQFEYMLKVCLLTQDPYGVTVYLQELAELFHKFYDAHRVLSDNQTVTMARLSLIQATRIVILTGLNLLGISSPEKM
jgi:arginyl-tRNA synthetase